jgi:hypothetical protein
MTANEVGSIRAATSVDCTHHDVVVGSDAARSRRLSTYIRRDVDVRRGREETDDGEMRESSRGDIVTGRASSGDCPRHDPPHPLSDEGRGT